jgi:hypothetical protein
MTRGHTAIFSTLAPLTLALSAGTLLAQGNQPKPAPTNVLTLETGDLDKYFVSPKDEALKRALRMIPARVNEVPGEVPMGNDAPPPQAFELLSRVLSSPVRLALSYNAENQGGFMGAGLVLSLSAPSEQEAKKTDSLVNSILQTTPLRPKPSQAVPGMGDILTPIGTVRLGPRQTAKGWAYEIQAGTVGDPDASFAALDSINIAGVTPHTRVRFDAAPLAPLLDFVEMFAAGEPEAAAMIQQVRESGVLGPDGLKSTIVSGYTADRSVSVITVKGLAPLAPKMGISRSTLTEAQLRVIPADAHWGGMGIYDPTYIRDQINTASQVPQARQGLDEFKQITGVDLVTDVVGTIGGTVAYYLADSTGGGGMTSIVMAVSVSDKDRLASALAKITATANNVLAQPDKARGYAAVRDWTDSRAPGCAFHSVSFPGLPVPVEVTFAMAGDWLVAGLTPQATLAAARQASGKGDGGILSNPRIADAMPKGAKFNGFSFADPTKTLREGYPAVSFVGSAVANLVRSRPGGAGRDPGLLVPTYPELLEGARASVAWSTWEGDDYIYRREGDRSQLVCLGMSAGKITPFLPLLTMLGMGGAMHHQAEEMNKWQHHLEGGNMEEGDDENKQPEF